MRKLRRNKKNMKLVRKIKNLFDTAFWVHKWGHVNILDSQCEVADVRGYLDFISKLKSRRVIPFRFNSTVWDMIVSPAPLIYRPTALRDDNADLYYCATLLNDNILRDRHLNHHHYRVGDIVYINIKGSEVKVMRCKGCGTPIVGDNWIETHDSGHVYCTNCEDVFYYKCESCGEYFDQEYMTASNDSDRHICDGCYEDGADDWFYCEECEEYCVGDSYRAYDRNGNEVYVCESCLDNYYHNCNDCDEYVHDNCGRWVDSSTWVCDSCLEDHWRQCYNCDEWYHEDDMYYDDDTDEWYCTDCYNSDDRRDYGEQEDGIRGYHEDRGGSNWESRVGDYGMEYLITETRTDNPMLGVELEIDEGGYKHDNARTIRRLIGWDYIICSSDGSLNNGFEMVSCPADLQSHANRIDWKAGMDKAIELGYKSHDAGTCGLHTHIDREFFGDEDQSEVDAKFTVVFRNNLWWFKNFSRRDDRRGSWSYCRPNGEQYLNVEDKLGKDVVKNKSFVNQLKGRGGHGIALNFEHQNTIEIRFYRGTLKYISFMAALQCSDMWARLVKGITIEDSADITLADFIRVAQHKGYTQFLDYINERGISLDNEPKRKKVRFVTDDEYHYINFDGSSC